ncbi:MAG: SDR family oxidoreductase, partial [Luminiphilus sp.]
QLLAQYPDRKAVDAAIEALHPVGRLGSPEDVANTVYWLASPDAGFITGQEVIVDGGRLAKLPLPAL